MPPAQTQTLEIAALDCTQQTLHQLWQAHSQVCQCLGHCIILQALHWALTLVESEQRRVSQ